MPITSLKQRKQVRIHPGDYYVTCDRQNVLVTLLGSCVAACMYDQTSGIAGMNHFLLSSQRHGGQRSIMGSEVGRYGVHAMELLINGMMKLGAKRQFIRAKVFGGGAVLKFNGDIPMLEVGTSNARFVKEFLKSEKIPIMASDMEGVHGRVIYFDPLDCSVFVRRIEKNQTDQVLERDRKFFKKQLEEQTKIHRPGEDVELWKTNFGVK